MSLRLGRQCRDHRRGIVGELVSVVHTGTLVLLDAHGRRHRCRAADVRAVNGVAPALRRVPGRKARLTEDERVEIVFLREEGWSLKRIASRVGCSHSTVLRVLEADARKTSHA